MALKVFLFKDVEVQGNRQSEEEVEGQLRSG